MRWTARAVFDGYGVYNPRVVWNGEGGGREIVLHINAHGAPLGLGFACVSEVEMLGGGLYRVYFGVYGEGEAWNAADCALLPEQAANLYDQTPPRQGCAVIRTLGLGSRNGMTLKSLLIE